MAQILSGAPVAETMLRGLRERIELLRTQGMEPTLAIVRVGEKEEEAWYERSAVRCCGKVGIRTESLHFSDDCGEDEVIAALRKINDDPGIHGCLLLRPLPKTMNERRVCEALSPEKDVDGITSASISSVFTGKGDGFAPCAPQSSMEILDYYGIDICGKRAAVLGRSLVVGRPIAMLALARDATVTICHRKTENTAELCRASQVLFLAAGEPGIADESYLSPGQIIVDTGVSVSREGKLCGDADFEKASALAAAITPVPGGVGTVTTAVLCKHVVEAAERRII